MHSRAYVGIFGRQNATFFDVFVDKMAEKKKYDLGLFIIIDHCLTPTASDGSPSGPLMLW